MGKKKVYKVVCRDTLNSFIHGKISGIMSALEGGPYVQKAFAIMRKNEVIVFRVETTKLRYKLMCKHIELQYPGLCEFEI